MSKTILLADDSITIQKIVNLTFTGEGIDVVTVGNGEAALKKVTEIHPDLVLADIFMPGKNGYEVCEHIKTTPGLDRIPVILLVGAFEPFDGGEAARVKADGHLTKPFEIKVLISAVNSLVHSAPEETIAEPIAEEAPAIPEHPAQLDIDAPAATEGRGAEADIETWAAPDQIPPSTAPAPEPSVHWELPIAVSSSPEVPIDSASFGDRSGAAEAETDISLEWIPESAAPVTRLSVPEELPLVTPSFSELPMDSDSLGSSRTITPEKPIVEDKQDVGTVPAAASVVTLEEADPLGLYGVEPLFAGSSMPAADSRSLVVDIWEPKGVSVLVPEVLSELPTPIEVNVAGPASELLTQKATSFETAELFSPEVRIGPEGTFPAQQETREADAVELPPAGGLHVLEPQPQPVSQQSMASELSRFLENPELIDLIARKVVERLGREAVEKIAWEVVPDLAEIVIKEHVEAHFKSNSPA
jgi:CheY-like chemotaxis protein